jgi:hypothetical protein
MACEISSANINGWMALAAIIWLQHNGRSYCICGAMSAVALAAQP